MFGRVNKLSGKLLNQKRVAKKFAEWIDSAIRITII